MTYTCPVCKRSVEGDLIKYIDHTEEHILDEIKREHPEWTDDDGVCLQCYDYLKKQIRGN